MNPVSVLRRLQGFLGFHAKSRKFDYHSDITGIIHVGANLGQEAESYAESNLNVVWIEPIPEIFEQLEAKVSSFAQQICFNDLITDQDGVKTPFFIANNMGESSSVLKMDEHSKMWSKVKQDKEIILTSKTLPTLLSEKEVDINNHDALLLDTQGSELMILKGAESILQSFRYIECEAANFSAYAGCPHRQEIEYFLKDRGFSLIDEIEFGDHSQDMKKHYYQLLFSNDVLITKKNET